MSSIGMYLLLPIIGNLADVYGTVLLSLTSVLTFLPSYLLALYVYETRKSYYAMTFCFLLIGLGTSCLYFASLLTCAHMYPQSKGLSISLPVTCYGLSLLVSSHVIQNSTWFHEDDGSFNIGRIFRFFSAMYILMGFLSYSASCILTMLKQANLALEERASLTEGVSASYHSLEDALHNDELIDEADLVAELSHQKRFKKFLREPSAHIFLAAFFLCIGPLEMYINNMGSLTVLVNKLTADHMLEIVSNTKNISISTQVSYHAFFSTCIRLAVGGASDYLARVSPDKLFFKKGLSRVWLLIICLAVGAVDQFGILYMLWCFQGSKYKKMDTMFKIISSGAGLSYGGIFTLYPSIMASIWGIEILGSTWGTYMVAPAFASILYGVVYAQFYDHYGDYRVGVVFLGTAVSILLSLGLTYFTWRFHWAKRGYDIF